MWIYDKLFNRKIEGKSSLDGLAENVVVNKETNTTEIGGNVNIDGNFTANSIIEKMTGYSYISSFTSSSIITPKYVGAVKNGNKLTIAFGGIINVPAEYNYSKYSTFGGFYLTIPSDVASKIIPLGASDNANALDSKIISAFNTFDKKIDINTIAFKSTSYGNSISISFYGTDNQIIENNKDYAFRYEITFLLSDNLAGN